MEDLDALLADLQMTTSHISNQTVIQPVQQNEAPSVEYSTVNVNRHPSYPKTSTDWSTSKRDSTDSIEDQPPPLPPPPSQDVLDCLNGSDSQDPNLEAHNFQRLPPATGSTPIQGLVSERGRAKPAMSTLSSNLSELDSLLADLNSAQFMAEVDKRNSSNQKVTSTPARTGPPTLPKPGRDVSDGRPVDALLDDLQNAVPSSGGSGGAVSNGTYQSVQQSGGSYQSVQPSNGTYQSVQPSNRSFAVAGPAVPVASTATKELDDLMASLSQFKVAGNAQNRGAGDYSAPMKKTTPPPGASQASPAAQQPVRGDQLDAMLGNLQTDMSRHGVTTVPKGHCAACNKPIVGQVITALGHTWHPEHFTCSHCHEELGTKNFFERDGQPFCEKDYHGLFSPRCAYCNGPILDKCITALDRTWHPEHFFCAQCGRPFQDDGFHEKNGKAYCRDDYFEMFAPKCGGCNRPIMDNYISALNRQWHPECFVCAECHISFGGGSFFDHEGMPYCETHYHARRGSLCAGCQKPITGRCITAMYKKFHPEHFVCAFCLKQLNKGTFKEQNDKPYCHPCFVKLFG